MPQILRIGAPIVLLLALVIPATAATPVGVHARAGWVSTGVAVHVGQTVGLVSLGSVHTAPIPDFLVPGVSRSASGPAGQTGGQLCGDVEAGLPPDVLAVTGPCAVDAAYFGQLVGRIGDTAFAIGQARSFVAPASGTLELSANDLTLTYFDNVGTFTVLFP